MPHANPNPHGPGSTGHHRAARRQYLWGRTGLTHHTPRRSSAGRGVTFSPWIFLRLFVLLADFESVSYQKTLLKNPSRSLLEQAFDQVAWI